MTQLDMLLEARDMIDTPDKWCQDTPMCNDDGKFLGAGSKGHTRFSLVGALWVIYFDRNNATDHYIYDVADTYTEITTNMRRMLDRDYNPEYPESDVLQLAGYNDHPDTTHDDIMKFIDRAIDNCKNAMKYSAPQAS